MPAREEDATVNTIEVSGFENRRRQPFQTREKHILGSKDTVGNIIAMLIIGTFAGSILLCFVYLFILLFRSGTADISSAFDLFKTVSSVLSGPLGFVLGFYFRQQLRDRVA